MTNRPRSRWRMRTLAVLFGLVVAVLLLEGVARVLVMTLWEKDKLAAYTEIRDVVGRFASSPDLPYVLAPGLTSPATTHNSAGFRGPEIAVPKPPGGQRVACVGASTTYGFPGTEPDSYPRQLEKLLAARGTRPVDVVNAGVPGWVSTEILRWFETRVAGLSPDIVVFYEGRNEVFPQGYEAFRPDYGHYRRADYSVRSANEGHKRFFRWSQLAMVLCTWRGDRFGWSSKDQNPAYGCIRFENKPDAARFAKNLADPARREPFRARLLELETRSAAIGARLVLVTFACRPEKLGTGNLDADPGFNEPFGSAVLANNEIVRAVAKERNLVLVEGAALADDASLFLDDCHFTPAGYHRLAELVAQGVGPLLGSAPK